MDQTTVNKLRSLHSFEALVGYLRDELDWPIEADDVEELSFEYEPGELGIDEKHAVKIESIRQVRPLVDEQPWGIFFIEFETKRLPVVVLRRILRSLVPTNRSRSSTQAVWDPENLLFISSQGDENKRSISFAHFRQYHNGGHAELRTFSWDASESHFYYIQNLNLEALRWPEDETNVLEWEQQWSSAFTVTHRYTIQKSQELAREMARHAQTVRDLVKEVYRLEAKDGPLHTLFNHFQVILLHDLEPSTFADMIAQTVTYGLFSAAIRDNEHLTYDSMVDLIPNTNPFLKDLLLQLTTEGGIDLEELGIDQLLDLFRQTDMEAIQRDFGRQSGGGREDPIVHFYELFLSEYDKAQRVERGVFYTPDPVVSYIVRSVDYLLKTEFGLEDGLADTSVDPETGEPVVQILDPATGTGTFLAHVIDVIESTVKQQGVDWNEYVAEHLLPRLNGFELMMAPYAVGHMKLGLKLLQTGYDFNSDERLRVYLTNTLERGETAQRAFEGFLDRESRAASQAKRQRPITVVVGNPPYSGHSMNKNTWIEEPLQDYYRLHGKPLNERNPKYLQDDYVKFIRFAQWRIDQTGRGILAFITNHGYLDNPTFRGMRHHLMKSFSEIYILDLHGNANRRETSPDGGKDENVFDIRQGVAIGIFIKRQERDEVANVYHADLWGTRESKYTVLQQTRSMHWETVEPRPPFYLFRPQNTDWLDEYEAGWRLNEIMPVNSTGVKTHRDHFVFDIDKTALSQRVAEFRDLSISDTEIAEKYHLKDTGSWSLRRARIRVSAVADWTAMIKTCAYRPFDNMFVFYCSDVIDRPRQEVMRHLLASEHSNLGLVFMRQVSLDEDYTHFSVSRFPVDNRAFFSNKGTMQLAPLYIYPDDSQLLDVTEWELSSKGRRPNLTSTFIQEMENRLRMQFRTEGRGDLVHTFGPEDFLEYAFAIFCSPEYRNRYAEYLEMDFPRVFITSNKALFRQLSRLGADLIAYHLMEDNYPAASWSLARENSPLRSSTVQFVEQASGRRLGSISSSKAYDSVQQRIFLDTANVERSSYFQGVSNEVWAFQLGGYQVLHKWLYDRRRTSTSPGYTLTEDDIEHYKRMVVAIQETIRLMAEIDEVIEEHGGWPIQ